MKIVTYRNIFTTDATQGRTYIDGNPFCYSLEDAVRGYGIKIPGKTAIGAGLYKVKLRHSPSFGRDMVMLWNEGDACVANGISFTFIYSHGGTHAMHSKGCILSGFIPIDDTCIRDTAEHEICDLVKKALADGDDVTWMVVNDTTGGLEPNR